MVKNSTKPNPRGRVKDWKKKLAEIERLRTREKDPLPLDRACVHVNIAYSTYYAWKKRLASGG